MNPYASDTLEASLKQTLLVLQERGPAPSPSEEILEAAKNVSPPLAAFAYAVGAFLPGPDFGPFELEAELAEVDEWQDEPQAEGLNPNDCLMVGTTGGGDQILFMAGEESEAGYALFLFAMDGEPYPASDSALWKVGTFAQLFEYLSRDDRELDHRLAALAG